MVVKFLRRFQVFVTYRRRAGATWFNVGGNGAGRLISRCPGVLADGVQIDVVGDAAATEDEEEAASPGRRRPGFPRPPPAQTDAGEQAS